MGQLSTEPDLQYPVAVGVLVDFYDNKEKKKFLDTFPEEIIEILQKLPEIYEIPTPDFCTYYLFYKKRIDVPSSTSFSDLSKKWKAALSELDCQVEFTDSSIRTISAETLNKGTTERLGEAICLSVASKLHNLHQADWSRIPETSLKKTLDYTLPCIASDGKQFIQVEAKGSNPPSVDEKTSSISKQRNHIRAKKNALSEDDQAMSILYGMIGVVDNDASHPAKCLLVDPPSDGLGNPSRFKIINRLVFIANLISLISPKSLLAATLQTRVSALQKLNEIDELNFVKLRKGNGEQLLYKEYENQKKSDQIVHHPFFENRSTLTKYNIGGDISAVDKDTLMFIGVEENLIELVLSQDFKMIQNYKFAPSIFESPIRCIIPTGRFDREIGINWKVPERWADDSKPFYVSFQLSGVFHRSQSGLVYGVLAIPEGWKEK